MKLETEVVLSYVPTVLAELVSEGGDSPPWGDMVEGTLVMADVSGFTTMSERLAEAGREGAERLTDVINGFFGRHLDLDDPSHLHDFGDDFPFYNPSHFHFLGYRFCYDAGHLNRFRLASTEQKHAYNQYD